MKHTVFWGIQKKIKRWDRKTMLSKRQQLVIITMLLTTGMVLTQLVSTDFRYSMVALLSLTTYFLTAFGLRDDLKRVEWVTLLTLPTLFTAAVGLFYFLLPSRWITRIPIALMYAVGMYALLLTENIYNVAANRTIALLRAAHSVGFLLTLVTFYLLTQTLLANKFLFIINIIGIGVLSFFLYLQVLWSMTLEQGIGKLVWALCIILTIILMQVAWVLSFWPVNTTTFSLFLTTCFYGTAGLAQQYVIARLYRKTVYEFLAVVSIVFVVVLVTTTWRGNF